MTYKANVVITHDEDGYYAFCLQLPGCHANGNTLETAQSKIKSAIDQHMAAMDVKDIEGSFNMEVITTIMDVEYPGE